MFAQGAKSSIMSCREAIFTFIRWAKGDDSHLNLSTISGSELRRTGLYGHCECASPTTSMNPRLPSTNLNFESECEQLSLKGRSNIDAMEHLPTHLYPKRADSPIFPKPGTTGGSHVPDTPQLLKCKEDVCRIGDLKEICSKPKSRMTTAQIDVCKMCHPRDEARLHSYCSVREQREHRAFWVVAAMLGALTLAVGVAVVFNDCCRKRKRRGPAGGTATRREGEPGIYWRRIFGSIRCPIRIRRKPKAPREPLELELADVKDGMFTRTFCNSDGNSLIEYDKELGIKKVEKALIKTSTSGYYSEKTTVGCVPVMPRARASSPSLHQISIQSFIRSTRGSEASGVAVRESASNSPDPFSDDLWKAKYRAQGL